MGRDIEAAGLDHVWLANIFSYDAITALTLIGRETKRVRLGTAVTPTYPRHPTALAQQAMTAAAATVDEAGGRTANRLVQLQLQVQDLANQRRAVQRAFKNEAAKKKRLVDKAKKLSSSELMGVIISRIAADAEAKALVNAKPAEAVAEGAVARAAGDEPA